MDINNIQKQITLFTSIFLVGNCYAWTADDVPRYFKPMLVPPMKQQEVLIFLITSNEAEPTTMSWSSIKVFMSRRHAQLAPAKNKERNATGDHASAPCLKALTTLMWWAQIHWRENQDFTTGSAQNIQSTPGSLAAFILLWDWVQTLMLSTLVLRVGARTPCPLLPARIGQVKT